MTRSLCLSIALFAAFSPALLAADSAPLVQPIESFGPVASQKEAQETYGKALIELQKTGGVLSIPAALWKQLKPQALQALSRTPAPPAETKQWREGNGVTILSADNESVIVQVPPMSGLRIERPIRLADGDSLPHWGTHPALTLDSQIVYGSSSYLDWLQEPVEKGLDRRFYLPTVRGLRPGQFLNLHGGPGYGGGVTRGCIKSLGYDEARRMPYFIADTTLDHVAGAILHNKSNTGLVHMLQTSHNDNQTYDMKIIRNQYAHGDTYMYYCDFNYMSNIHSAAGDENGNCYAAFIRTKGDNFRASVKSVEWPAGKLEFSGGGNLHTLGDSRPLINLNPAKHLAAGKVIIVPSNRERLMPDGSECKSSRGSRTPRSSAKDAFQARPSSIWGASSAATRIALGLRTWSAVGLPCRTNPRKRRKGTFAGTKSPPSAITPMAPRRLRSAAIGGGPKAPAACCFIAKITTPGMATSGRSTM